MARVQYGTIVTEIKGKNQGHVFQGGNVGFVLRSKGYTPGISSGIRTQANRNLISQTTRWKTLTDAQRAAWNTLASTWLFYNKFGAAYQGSGFQVFNSYNTNLLTLGQAVVNTPGAFHSPTNPDFVDFDWTNALNGQVVLGNTPVTNDCMALFAAAPQSAGRNTNHNRYNLLFAGNINTIDTFVIGPDYDAIFPTPVIGQRITIKAVFYDQRYPYPFYPTISTTIRIA